MAQPTAPAELVVASEVVTVVVPVKFSKPGMVCRVNTMDWPLMLSVVSEGPDATNASRSEDMGGVKLPDAEADDPGGSVIIGIDGKDDVLRDATVKTPCMLAVTLEVSPVGVVAGVLFADSKLIWEIEMFLANDDERGEPLGLNSSCELLES